MKNSVISLEQIKNRKKCFDMLDEIAKEIEASEKPDRQTLINRDNLHMENKKKL